MRAHRIAPAGFSSTHGAEGDSHNSGFSGGAIEFEHLFYSIPPPGMSVVSYTFSELIRKEMDERRREGRKRALAESYQG